MTDAPQGPFSPPPSGSQEPAEPPVPPLPESAEPPAPAEPLGLPEPPANPWTQPLPSTPTQAMPYAAPGPAPQGQPYAQPAIDASGLPHTQPLGSAYPPPPTGQTGAPLPPPPPPGTWPVGGQAAPAYQNSAYGPGTNGLAIAALVCSLVFFVPLLAPLAIIFGIIALRQISRVPQGGKGMAIAGIVIGTIVTLFWALIVIGIATDDSLTTANDYGTVKTDGRIRVDRLIVGQCFDGLTEGHSVSVQAKACTERHEAEVYASFELPDTAWPGENEAAAMADDGCASRGDVLKSTLVDDLDILYFYPDSGFAWRTDREVLCIASDPDSNLTTSVRR